MSEFLRRTYVGLSAAATAALLLSAFLPRSHEASAQDPLVFRHAFDDSVLDVYPQPGEQTTNAVLSFHETGRDPYVGDPSASAQGNDLYENWCKGCHMPDGSGGMGPSLVDDVFIYDRVPTDIGLFEVMFAGAGGAMQSFAKRMSQDDMLKVVAYIRHLQMRKH